MNNIPGLTHGDFNIGSVRDLLFVPVDNVTSIKDPVDGVLEFDCLQNDASPATMFLWEFTDDKCEFKYTEKKTANGPVFTQIITGNTPKDYSFRNPLFTELQNHEFFVIVRDNNNKSRLIGFINLQVEKYGMKLSVDFSTSPVRSGYNGFPFEFTMESIIRPQVMEDITSIPIDAGFPIDINTGVPGDVDPPPSGST